MIAIFFYMKLTTGQQTMSAPTQEGMPDMQKMMKSILDEIEGLREEPEQFEVQYGGHTPQFDGEWYCP